MFFSPLYTEALKIIHINSLALNKQIKRPKRQVASDHVYRTENEWLSLLTGQVFNELIFYTAIQ